MQRALAALHTISAVDGDEQAYQWLTLQNRLLDSSPVSAISDDRFDDVEQAVRAHLDRSGQ
jgi:hypothetical protein